MVLGIGLFVYVYKLSPRARKAWTNVENSEKIAVSMESTDLVRIMGKPDTIRRPYVDLEKGNISYYYEPPFMASDGIRFVLDSDNRVIKIYPYEGT